MNLLKGKFEELIQMEDTDDGIFDFKEMLLESDDNKVLEYHFSLLSTIKDEYLYRDILFAFSDRANKDEVSLFLYQKYKDKNITIKLKADIIQVLGDLGSKYAHELAIENISNPIRDLRYRSIIVLGWVGNARDLSRLNERLLNDDDGQLRGYSATAMRQIWFNHPKTKDSILTYLKIALPAETDEKAIEGIIISAQDLLRKKLGLKESQYGDVEGDIAAAKEKTIEAFKYIS